MNQVKVNLPSELKPDELTVSGLRDLYNDTISDLRECANIKPGYRHEEHALDQREEALLDFEMTLLKLASRIKISSKSDMLGLMDIWEKASGVNTGGDAGSDQALSNRIAMNIFRHMVDEKFAIE